MRIALITPANLWYCPFVKIYSNVLDSLNIDYDIITLCRDGKSEKGCIEYVPKKKCNLFFIYLGYIRFIKKKVRENHYDRLIVFTSQLSILLTPYLYHSFRKKYIIDIRDLSIEQKPLFRAVLRFALKQSFANFVSSSGFLDYLPMRDTFLLSHNFDLSEVQKVLNENALGALPHNDTINVLTIGGIRDYSSNIEVVKTLGNKKDFKLYFVGKGNASDLIKEYCHNNNITNVFFHGYYPKEEEPDYIKEATFLNIFYPRRITHDTALSNRFYNSLIYKRPMIVTSNTTQGYYVKTYNLGLYLDDCRDLDVKLREWVEGNSYADYCGRANGLLSLFLKDYNLFYEKVSEFVQ